MVVEEGHGQNYYYRTLGSAAPGVRLVVPHLRLRVLVGVRSRSRLRLGGHGCGRRLGRGQSRRGCWTGESWAVYSSSHQATGQWQQGRKPGYVYVKRHGNTGTAKKRSRVVPLVLVCCMECGNNDARINNWGFLWLARSGRQGWICSLKEAVRPNRSSLVRL
jgi:hypothetical protein